MQAEIVIVGAGITGATLAERCANALGKKVLVLEKRNHIGGNCYDYYDEADILVPKYGPHFFHTDHKKVWDYLSRFTDWHEYEHRVLSYVDGKYVPVPVNIDTVNILFDLNIRDENQMKAWLEANSVSIRHPANSEESALARVGPKLYEKMFRHYTIKQWSLEPKDLDASVMDRIPVRHNRDDRYFGDKYQAMPARGYTKLFENMLDHPNIAVRPATDYFKVKSSLGDYETLFFTGPIDRFFDYRFGRLQYRSLEFEFETLSQEFYQPRAQVNYPNDYGFTRITEPKHATGQVSESTTIIREYSTWEGEPYYPVLSQKNKILYGNYCQEAEKLRNVHLAGRLGNYRYLNMDAAFLNALQAFEEFAGMAFAATARRPRN